MLKAFLGLIGFGGPEQEGRALARDARSLIDMFHGQNGAEKLGLIARSARLHVDEVHERGLNDPQFYKRGVEHLTELNRAARQRRDDVAWSGITLAIIYIKSEILGAPGQAARNAIDGFLSQWRHIDDAPADGDAQERTDR